MATYSFERLPVLKSGRHQETAIPEVALLERDLKLDGLNLPEIPITIQRAAEVLSSFVTLGAGS